MDHQKIFSTYAPRSAVAGDLLAAAFTLDTVEKRLLEAGDDGGAVGIRHASKLTQQAASRVALLADERRELDAFRARYELGTQTNDLADRISLLADAKRATAPGSEEVRLLVEAECALEALLVHLGLRTEQGLVDFQAARGLAYAGSETR